MTSGLAGYLLIAIALAFAMDHVALPFGPGLYNSEQPVSLNGFEAAVVVDRARKGDRLVVAPISTSNNLPARKSQIPLGCDTAFSQLAGASTGNFVTRCLATNAIATPVAGIVQNSLCEGKGAEQCGYTTASSAKQCGLS
ncbi:MAG TPA: hypothetical protein VFK79_12685 [Xanthobacteraceae bacterium]|nr:hypothetical protein [Xanthobacteraceae bacterium]